MCLPPMQGQTPPLPLTLCPGAQQCWVSHSHEGTELQLLQQETGHLLWTQWFCLKLGQLRISCLSCHPPPRQEPKQTRVSSPQAAMVQPLACPAVLSLQLELLHWSPGSSCTLSWGAQAPVSLKKTYLSFRTAKWKGVSPPSIPPRRTPHSLFLSAISDHLAAGQPREQIKIKQNKI